MLALIIFMDIIYLEIVMHLFSFSVLMLMNPYSQTSIIKLILSDAESLSCFEEGKYELFLLSLFVIHRVPVLFTLCELKVK